VADQLTTSMDLIELANSPRVKRLRDTQTTALSLDVDQVAAMYEALVDTAPHRHERKKDYFVGHSGVPSTVGPSTRLEEHLAIALCNDHATLPIHDSDGLRLLDYQVPLKARQSDVGIGKIDIVGFAAPGRVAVIELKVTTPTSRGDTPLRAFLEALAYCAIVEANAADFSAEIDARYGLRTVEGLLDLVVMGPNAYWSSWTGAGLNAVIALADRLTETLGIRSRFLNLGDVSVATGIDGSRPRVLGDVQLAAIPAPPHQ
jgi:hypothetical protein